MCSTSAGAASATDGRSIYEEGLFVPITKLFDAGEPNDELLKIIARQRPRAGTRCSATSTRRRPATMSARARLLEFMDEFDLRRSMTLADEIIGRSERAMRAAIAAVPDGVYKQRGLLATATKSRCGWQVTITKTRRSHACRLGRHSTREPARHQCRPQLHPRLHRPTR